MALTNAEKQRRWRERHPDRYADKLAARRRLNGGRKYRCGRRGEWGYATLHDPDGPDHDIPRVAVACRVDGWPGEWLWHDREVVPGPLGEWLRGLDQPPAAAWRLRGIRWEVALALRRAETRRLAEILGEDYYGPVAWQVGPILRMPQGIWYPSFRAAARAVGVTPGCLSARAGAFVPAVGSRWYR